MSRVGAYVRLWRPDYGVRDASTFNAKMNRLHMFTALGRSARPIELAQDAVSWALIEYVDETDDSGIVLARWVGVSEETAVMAAQAWLEGVLFEITERDFWAARLVDDD